MAKPDQPKKKGKGRPAKEARVAPTNPPSAKPQNKQSHERPKCGHPKSDGTTCGMQAGWGTKHVGRGTCRKHGGAGGAPEGNKNAEGHGAPAGNTNSRKHGLFSASLGPEGQEALEQAKEMTPDALAREAANFAIAKVAEVFAGNPEVKGVIALIDDFLEDLITNERLSYEGKAFIMRRLTEPDIAMLGKALSPIKGLLETKKVKDTEAQANALNLLAETVARSQRRRDEGG